MKKSRIRLLSLLLAMTVFMTSGTVVSATEAGSTAAETKTEENAENKENSGTPSPANTETPENTGTPDNGTANPGNVENAGTAGNEGTPGASDSGAPKVEGTFENQSGDGSQQNAGSGQPQDVQGTIIIGEDNDDVEIKANDKPYLSLGADLTDAQRATVLSIMGIDPANLGNYDVVYVTNAEEHQYLDSYISSSQIGSRSLSSVVIMERKKGNGLNISTNNITYCTVGMYKNALTTAGIADADIIVAGPTGISGTAALVGIFKAYQEMTGKKIEDNVVDAALNELVITGQLEESIEGLTDQEVEEFIAYIKSVIAQNDLKDEASINGAIDEACEKYGVTLSDSERQKIVDLLLKITSLGIDLNGLVDYAASLYNSFKNGGNGGGGILSSIGDFFSNAFSAIGDFFKNLFS